MVGANDFTSGSSGDEGRPLVHCQVPLDAICHCGVCRSEDFSTLRWSWSDFLLVDEITDVRLSPSNPLTFYVKYAPLTSSTDDEVRRHSRGYSMWGSLNHRW